MGKTLSEVQFYRRNDYWSPAGIIIRIMGEYKFNYDHPKTNLNSVLTKEMHNRGILGEWKLVTLSDD